MKSLLSQMSEISAIVAGSRNISEIMCNPDGRIWIEEDGTVTITDLRLDAERIYSIIRLLAGHYELVINKEHPELSVKLPVLQGGRFEALVPPVVSGPAFSIRIPPRTTISLDELLEK
ncbi:MAG: Flp pilus assembly complex ATPase component TadA, partial [Spirochaetales bacterium]|nr:Flp pilus assembly complex ATPase component TadA [Spirochaetales bacterium]